MLKAIAFLAGAALMGLEIVGSRVLAPYFGSSVFVWGSLIGVLLSALSAGAYLGGALADRRPDTRPLAGMLALAGASVLVLPWVAPWVNAAVFGLNLGPRLSTLIASSLLFLVPGVALGAVSPFIIRMEVSGVCRVGHVAGTVAALSTAGSIAGTLLTSFYLISALGVRSILWVIGAGLVGLAGVVMIGWKRGIEN